VATIGGWQLFGTPVLKSPQVVKWVEKEERLPRQQNLRRDEYSGRGMGKIPQIGESGAFENRGLSASDFFLLKNSIGLEKHKNLSQRGFAQIGIMDSSQKITVLYRGEPATDQRADRGAGIESG
jgi:hypothetical protein